MSTTDTGQCPYCNAVNSYNDAKCTQCNEELPWANWVQARQQSAAPLGAKRGDFASRGGQSVNEGFAMPGGAASKLFLMLLAFVLFAVAFRALSPVMRSASSSNVASNSAIVEKFQKANPILKQEKELGQEQR